MKFETSKLKLPKKIVQNDPTESKDENSRVTEEYLKLFSALDIKANGFITKEDLLTKIADSGILFNDLRIETLVKRLSDFPEVEINFTQFKTIVQNNSSLLKNIIQNRLAIPDFNLFCKDIAQIFGSTKSNKKGQPASYIPQLARVDPNYFSAAITTVSGQRFALGNSKIPFCLQSVNKPINYCLALQEHGTEKVHKHIGREPSGRGFNEISLNEAGLPHNPMINAGAIMCCSLIKPELSLADRFDFILQAWKKLSGYAHVGFNNPVYLSERETADRNFALGYFMREKNAFPENTDLVKTLEFYFQCCSIEIDAEGLSVVAASLANGGICPTTGEKVFNQSTIQHCLSLMGSCGMYDFSGEFAFTIGLPSKSGVSGAIMLVVPNVLGIAIWSPPLDRLGNSVRGIEFCQKLVELYNFHLYDNVLLENSTKKDPRLKKNLSQIDGVVQLCWAASQGDLREVQNLIATGIDPNGADYDGRTALHIAACEGHTKIVEYLISRKSNVDALDRWNNTPFSDAKREKKTEVIKIFEKQLKI